MTDPQPLAFSLPDARRRLMRPVESGQGDELDPGLEEVRRKGMEQIMEAKWSRTAWSKFSGATWEWVDREHPMAAEQLRAWVAMSKPTNLVILGPVGIGKTSAAALALRPSFDACLEVVFARTGQMLDQIKEGFGQPDGVRLSDFSEADRLLLDDVGQENKTPWTREQLGSLISDRYNDERPTVVTSNFKERDLEEHLGAHAADRLLGDGAVIVVMRGQSRRRS